jgi:hypothetical protein
VTRALFLAATLVSVWLLWEAFPRVEVEAARDGSGTTPATPAPSRGPEPRPNRNLFAYEHPPEPAYVPDVPASRPLPAVAPAPMEMAPAVPELRLLGLLSQGGQPRALLSVEGETALLGEGESLRGYAVLSIADHVVRLRHPERGEISVQLAE